MTLNEAGRMVETVWLALPERFPHMMIDAFTIMPNHFHGIVCITNGVGAPLAAPAFDVQKCNQVAAKAENQVAAKTENQGAAKTENQGAASSAPTLGTIMRVFKSISAVEANRLLDRKGQPLWQRNYYERIVRHEKELNAIREYIAANPSQWAEDKENPDLNNR